MKKQIAFVLAVAALAAGAVSQASGADGEAVHPSIGLGFHSSASPIGGRWWIMDGRVGVDLGVGFSVDRNFATVDTNADGFDDAEVEDTLSRWSVDFGLPWALYRWEGVRVLLRPGVEYISEDDFGVFLDNGSKTKLNTLSATAEIEVEAFIARNLSVSASHGLEYRTSKLDAPGATAEWTIGSTAHDFTSLGFHVYLWGGETK